MNPLKPLVKISPAPPLLKPPPKAGSVDKKTQEWQSAGVRQKPETCKLCSYSYVGSAFVPDHFPAAPKIAYVFSHPRKDDCQEQRPLSGPFGDVLRKILITDLGRSEDEVALCHTLRCMPKRINTRNGPAYQYPTGAQQGAAERNCRQYDDSAFKNGLLENGGLITWNPTLFLTTLDIDTILEVGAFRFMIRQDVEKAWRFVDKGERVAVLFGSEVLSVVAGHLKGGSKRWRGSWWTSDGWPFETKIRREGFR